MVNIVMIECYSQYIVQSLGVVRESGPSRTCSVFDQLHNRFDPLICTDAFVLVHRVVVHVIESLLIKLQIPDG